MESPERMVHMDIKQLIDAILEVKIGIKVTIESQNILPIILATPIAFHLRKKLSEWCTKDKTAHSNILKKDCSSANTLLMINRKLVGYF